MKSAHNLQRLTVQITNITISQIKLKNASASKNVTDVKTVSILSYWLILVNIFAINMAALSPKTIIAVGQKKVMKLLER